MMNTKGIGILAIVGVVIYALAQKAKAAVTTTIAPAAGTGAAPATVASTTVAPLLTDAQLALINAGQGPAEVTPSTANVTGYVWQMTSAGIQLAAAPAPATPAPAPVAPANVTVAITGFKTEGEYVNGNNPAWDQLSDNLTIAQLRAQGVPEYTNVWFLNGVTVTWKNTGSVNADTKAIISVYNGSRANYAPPTGTSKSTYETEWSKIEVDALLKPGESYTYTMPFPDLQAVEIFSMGGANIKVYVGDALVAEQDIY